MVSKKPGKTTSADGGDEPFVLNKHKFPWHKELLASKVSPQAKVIGGWFAFHGLTSNGKLVAHHRRIVNETGIPYRTTQRAVAELAAHQFLFCDTQPGGGNLYTFIAAFQRQEWLDDETEARQAEDKKQQRAEREHQREASEAWLHAEKSWLRAALLSLADRGGAPVHQSAAWADRIMADALPQIEVARNSGRRLVAHPAREVLDGLDAARAAEAASGLT